MKSLEDALSFDVVDVFAERAFAGNPLAVVHGADHLDTAQLAAIAREFNLSETVFPLPPTQPGASYRARIFTPVEELPFAGHPSVGVAWVLARAGVIDYGDAVQECGAGLLAVSVDADGARISGGPPSVGPKLDALALAEAVGLTAADIDPVAEPGVASAGLEHVFLPVRPDALARARVPEAGALRAATGGLGMVTIVALDLAAGRVRSRMFGPGVGVNEDPATGSAALALAVFAVDRDLLPGLRPAAAGSAGGGSAGGGSAGGGSAGGGSAGGGSAGGGSAGGGSAGGGSAAWGSAAWGSARLPGVVRPAGGRPGGGVAGDGPAAGAPAGDGPAAGGPAQGVAAGGGVADGRAASGGVAGGGVAGGGVAGGAGRSGDGVGAANGTVEFRIEQGVEMGRPSVLEVEVTVAEGVVCATSVRGRVVPVSAGQIAVPPSGPEPS